MKKYGIVLFILAVALCLAGCKTRKNLQKESAIKSEVGNITTSFNKSIETKTAGSHTHIQKKNDEWEYRRKTEFDSLGNVRSVQESWRETGRSELALRNDSSRNLSVNDKGSTEKSTEETQISESNKSDLKSDNRPVQDSEWLWLILGIGTIAAILIIVFIKKVK